MTIDEMETRIASALGLEHPFTIMFFNRTEKERNIISRDYLEDYMNYLIKLAYAEMEEEEI